MDGTKSEPMDPRERLVRAGLAVQDELPMSKVFAGVTTAKVAEAAGVTTGSFFHHFRNHSEFSEALVMSAIPTAEDLAGQVDELVDSLEHFELFEVIRLSMIETWQIYRDDPGVSASLRFLYLLWAHPDAELSGDDDTYRTTADVLRENYRIRHVQAVDGWRHLLARTGRAYIPPFDSDRIAVALTAMFEGLLAREQFDPGAVDEALFADVAATLVASLTSPSSTRIRLAAIEDRPLVDEAPMLDDSHLSPQARSGARRRRESRNAVVNAAIGRFDHGWEAVSATELAEASGVSNQTVLNVFQSVREIAACTFARHIPELRQLAQDTAADDPLLSLHRVLTRLSQQVVADPEPARALLGERIAAKHRRGRGLSDLDIRVEVPIVQVLMPALERLDLGGSDPLQLVANLSDTVLSLALDHALRREDHAALAMRLLPPSATGVTPWTPAPELQRSSRRTSDPSADEG
ncbi:MAG: TetR/AcrR family transcriptional regulator [Microthrixaceae bacterium]